MKNRRKMTRKKKTKTKRKKKKRKMVKKARGTMTRRVISRKVNIGHPSTWSMHMHTALRFLVMRILMLALLFK